VIGVILAAILLGSWFGWSGYRHWRVERAIARFAASPSQSAADELALLLGTGIPTDRQGERILKLVLNPTVTTRRAYPADRAPTINIECPFHLVPPRTDDRCFTGGKVKSYIRVAGQETTHELGGFSGGLGYWHLFIGHETPSLPVGTHEGRVRIDCTLIRYEWHAPVWRRLTSLARGGRQIAGIRREIESYEAHLEIPLEIVVVEAAEAEQVTLVSDPELGEAIRQSFTCRHQDGYLLRGEPRPIAYNGVTVLKWKEAPIALVFEPVLRLPDGREILNPSRHITGVGRFRTRAGGSGLLYCAPFMTELPLAVPGEYEATVVLRPDPNLAYEDVTIKEIWGETLEFPISFTLTEEPPPDGQQPPKSATEQTVQPTVGQTL
jgi:hypothetical protein